MSSHDASAFGKVVAATHGRREPPDDPAHQAGLAEELIGAYGLDGLVELYGRFAIGDGYLDCLMRKLIWKAVSRRCGSDLRVGSGVGFKHLETFEIGRGVVIGAQAFIQGRHDGICRIGDQVWIGPQAYLDARNVVIEDHVGWGPGAKLLGSTHTGLPLDVPVIRTDLEIRPVRIGAWADIGTNAVILPGVTIGKGAIIGAGAVVASDVPPFAVFAGVPAKFLYWRKDKQREQQEG